MRMRPISLLVLAFALGSPAAHAAESTPDVRMVSCVPAGGSDPGSVTYQARMRSVPRAERMAIRFRVLQKLPDGGFEQITAKEPWHVSGPGASAFLWEHRVKGLRQGAAYRVIVEYRWLGSDGEVLDEAKRRSAVCRQRDGLPNLRVESIDIRRGEVEDSAVYRVTIANRGASAARRVGVVLRVDGEVVDEVEVIDTLHSGENRTVSFSGPVCRRRIKVVVDPKELIAESHEEDNVRDPACV